MDEPRPPEMAEREAAWCEAKKIWLIETQRALRDRKEFQVEEIADALARKPGRCEIDGQERRRIVIDVFGWIMRGEFDDCDVLMLVGSPQLFAPFLPEFRAVKEEVEQEGLNIWANPDSGAHRPGIELHLGKIRINIEALVLRRGALERYLEGCALEGVPRLRLEWFPESAAAVEPAAEPSPQKRAMSNAIREVPTETNNAATHSDEPERPSGVSDRAWERYRDAKKRKPGFETQRGGTAEAVRILAGGQKDETLINSIRRDLSRVRKALREKL